MVFPEQNKRLAAETPANAQGHSLADAIDGYDNAIEVANDTIYGLAASIWTADLKKAHRFARDIEAGIVWVNAYEAGDATTPWGGFKQSGNGRDKCLEALTQYTQTKSVWIDLN